jgi:hypothetical protein
VHRAILERVMASSKLDEDQREALERSADFGGWEAASDSTLRCKL